MIRLCVALTVLGSTCVAGTLCDDLNALQSDQLVLAQGVASCQSSLMLGGARNMNCVLEYPYRSAQAARAFDDIRADLAACLGPQATEVIDRSVNHPDAYDLREFDLNGRMYAVSIKDKGALQQTLVFVRVQME